MSAVAAPSVLDRPTQSPLPQRRFGKTEERVPILGLGTAPAGIGLPDDEAIALYHAALDRGVTYLDTAPAYARAQVQLGEVLRRRRDEAFVATKCATASAEEALKIAEQSLRDLQTDHVDLLYVHCAGSYEPDQLLAADGTFAALREAQRRGWTRFVGFTAHHFTPRSARLLQETDVDAVMLAMNYVDRHTYGFEEQALPLAVRSDVGVAAMKVFGGARGMEYEKERASQLGERNHHLAFRYALGLPGVAVAVIGMYTVEELERNVAWAKGWEALTGEELERLDAEGREVASEWGAHFGETG